MNMGKVLWHTMMSLDGFVAGPNDDMEWMSGVDGGEGRTIAEVLGSTGALLVGRRTQDVEDRDQPGFYGGAFRGPFFVLRHDPPADPPVVKGVEGEFLNVDIDEAVRVAKDAAVGADVVVLGANIARQCLEAGLLDEIIVHVAPVLVGGGVRLFERDASDAVRLRLVSSTQDGETAVLHYATT
jgi:dihydrofolate reductase